MFKCYANFLFEYEVPLIGPHIKELVPSWWYYFERFWKQVGKDSLEGVDHRDTFWGSAFCSVSVPVSLSIFYLPPSE